MVDTPTTHFGWVMPGDHVNTNTWGAILNSDLQAIDSQVWSITNAPVTFNGAVTFANGISVNGTVSGSLLYSSGDVQAAGNIGAVGSIAGSSFSASGDMYAVNMHASGTVTGAHLTSTGDIGGNGIYGTYLSSSGNINASNNISASGTVSAAQITSTANINATGTITAGNLTAGSTVTGAQITSTGNMNVTGTGTFGSVVVQNALQVKPGNSSITANVGGQYVMINGSSGFGSGSSFIVNGGQRSFAFEWYFGSTQIAEIGGDGSLYIQGPVGQKVSGTTWSNPSDARIKTVRGDYTAGLAEVLRLNPVTFTFKDNYTREAGETSPLAQLARDGTICVGLIAQEVEAIFPEMVTRSEAFLDGRRVTDFRNLDTSNLILALVNAVKDLKAEIEDLKAR